MPNWVAVLEKGIEFCSVLHVLISFPDYHPMTVKGGTSLSTVYRIINRFSEDVDITLDYRAFNDDFNPFATGISNTNIKQFSDRLKTYVKSHTQDVVMPALTKASERIALPLILLTVFSILDFLAYIIFTN